MISTVPRRFGSYLSPRVAGGPKRDSIPSKRVPSAERRDYRAKRTAELVLEHIQRHGNRSLGVITFPLRQQLAVLDELRKNRPDLEPFFREDRPEPFFVKNLENVQGDERDRIILSVAYGLNEETGRDSLSFGPLNRAGGER